MRVNLLDKTERMEFAKKKLLTSLEKEYGDIHLTTLESLAKEIKVIPSVRSGNAEKRDSCNYYELSPTWLNEYNELLVQERELGPANSRLIEKYALQYGDLLVSYRGFRGIAVGRFAAKECDKPAVGAVSNFRIRFSKEESEPLSLAVLSFLTSPLAQCYLKTRLDTTEPMYSASPKRYTLSKEFLCAMPIPDFRKFTPQVPLDAIYYTHKDLLHSAEELYKDMQNIYRNINNRDDDLLTLYLHKNHRLNQLLQESKEEIEKIKYLKQNIEKLNIPVYKDKKICRQRI